MDKFLLIDRNAALKSQNSYYQTYGCRHYNPNICKDNGWDTRIPAQPWFTRRLKQIPWRRLGQHLIRAGCPQSVHKQEMAVSWVL